MTPQQEAKLDRLHDMVFEVQGDMKSYKVQQINQSGAQAELAAQVSDMRDRIDGHDAKWNRVVGVTWIGTIITGIVAVITGIIAFFKHI